MKNKEALFTSKSDEWETPQYVFDWLNDEFQFGLDPCATEKNAKCKAYLTKDANGLEIPWMTSSVFVNPPYSNIAAWIEKAYKECLENWITVVLLIPARTDTKYWHRFVPFADEVRFIKGRIKFVGGKHSAPFPSAIVVFKSKYLSYAHSPIMKFVEIPK